MDPYTSCWISSKLHHNTGNLKFFSYAVVKFTTLV